MNYTSIMSLNQTLEALGISKAGAQVYLSALELGESTIQPLAFHAHLPRTTVYQVLRELHERGLISYSQKGKRRTVLAEDPHTLLELQQRNLQALTEALPELYARNNRPESKTKLFSFEGVEGVKAMYEDTLRHGESIRSFLQVGSVNQEIAGWLTENYMPRRAKHKIRIKNLVTGDNADHDPLLVKKGFYRDNRYISKSDFPADIELMVYGNRVAFVNYAKDSLPGGIIIENTAIANTVRSLHQLGWQQGKESE